MQDRHKYSMAFKQKVVEEIRDKKWTSASQAAEAYGIAAHVVYSWVHKLGYEHLIGRIIQVGTKTELEELKQLRKENKELKARLYDQTIDLHIEQVALDLACQRLNITPEEIKKKIPSK